MSPGELLARERIRDTMARYNLAGDRGDLEELALCFTETGAIELPGEGEVRGRGAILARLILVADGLRDAAEHPLLRHHLTTSRIEFRSENEARARSYFLAVTEIGPDHSGRYVDRFLAVDDEWLIAHRRVRIDWRAPNGLFPGPPS